MKNYDIVIEQKQRIFSPGSPFSLVRGKAPFPSNKKWRTDMPNETHLGLHFIWWNNVTPHKWDQVPYQNITLPTHFSPVLPLLHRFEKRQTIINKQWSCLIVGSEEKFLPWPAFSLPQQTDTQFLPSISTSDSVLGTKDPINTK